MAPWRPLLLLRSRVGKKREWGGDRMEAVWGVGRRPDRVMPVGRAAAATSPTYGHHVAGVGWSKAGASAHGRGGGGVGRAGERAEREAVGPAAPTLFSFL